MIYFFFSSRRRHTRCSRDWSSDVCSSDLDAQVILVADIDRGGVFAQIIGTLDLLAAEERRRVIGVIINKFRGDLSLFNDGVKYLEERTGLPVLGVIPFQRKLELDQEDSVEIERNQNT